MERMKHGVSDKRPGRSGGGSEPRPGKRRQFVPARELAEALADIPPIDYEQFRADIDAVFDDGGPKDWYEWAARTDRHVDLDRLEEV